MSKQQAIQNLS